MAVEHYREAVDTEKERLASALVAQLHQLQSTQREGEFRFDQYLGKQEKDLRTMKFLAAFRQMASYYRPTWNYYTYKDGELSVVKRQVVNLGNDPENIPGSQKQISLNEIPFADFSENDLIRAGRAIESVSIPTA